ncbi:MAG: hypothetical protein EAZ40_04025, partial [Rhodobacterales bacterium]
MLGPFARQAAPQVRAYSARHGGPSSGDGGSVRVCLSGQGIRVRSFPPVKITAARTAAMQFEVFKVRAHTIVTLLVRAHRTVTFRATKCRFSRHVESDGNFETCPALAGSNFANVYVVAHVLSL